MKTIAAAVALATALAATAASAEGGRLSDTEYLQAARCAGLASSSGLEAADGKQIVAWFKKQGGGRIPYVEDKAGEMRRQAKSQADRASGDLKAKLTAELQGVCAKLRA